MNETFEEVMLPQQELTEVVPPIYIETDNLDNVEYDQEDFARGVKDISYLCGQITALVNTGLPPEVALDYLFNLKLNNDNIENSIKLTELNSETQIKCAELSDAKLAMNTL